MSNIKQRLIDSKLLNQATGKISPWLERRIDAQLRHDILDATSFLVDEYSIADRVRIYLLGTQQQPTCIVCGKSVRFHKATGNFAQTCSQRTCVSSDAKAKRAATMTAAYGHAHFIPQSAMVKSDNARKAAKRSREVLVEKYGVTNPMDVPGVRQKHLNSLRRGLGSKTKFECGDHHAQRHFTQDMKNAVSNLDEVYTYHIRNKVPITNLSKQLGFSSSFLFNKMSDAFELKVFAGSYIQRKFYDRVSALVPAVENWRGIGGGKEIDIFIPSHSLGIEVNGVFWHSVNHDKVDHRHLTKLELCNQLGIRLIQFTTEQLETNIDLCLSVVRNALGLAVNKIHARKCSVVAITKEEEQAFLNKNHLDGFHASKVAYGIKHGDTLVGVASFGTSRFTNRYQWELIRCATDRNTVVVGGLGKLIAHFISVHNPKTIVSYVHRSTFTGHSLLNVGFKHIGNTKVGYRYTKDGLTLLNRMKYQKHKLSKILPIYNPALTEKQNMVNNGFRIYYDCGQSVYLLER